MVKGWRRVGILAKYIYLDMKRAFGMIFLIHARVG